MIRPLSNVRSILLVFTLAPLPLAAQLTSSTDGFTPPKMAPGSPESSYQLSGFDTVHPGTQHLNFRLVLRTIQGRGGIAIPIVLRLSRQWQVLAVPADAPPTQYRYFGVDTLWSNLDADYSPGYLMARPATVGGPDQYGLAQYSNLQLTFVGPDGTELELRDQGTLGHDQQVAGTGYNRGSVFVSVDGSAATFISHVHDASQTRTDILDDPYANARGAYPVTGTLFTRDGTRYKIAEGRIVQITDHNGNYATIGYDGNLQPTSITDSLGRTVTFSYNGTVEGDPNSTVDTITYKGSDGTDRHIRVYRTALSNVLRSGFSIMSKRELFPELTCAVPNITYCDTTPYDPSFLASRVVFENGDTFEFRYNSYAEVAQVILPTGGGYQYDYVSDMQATGNIPYRYILAREVVEKRTYSSMANGTLVARTSFGGSSVVTKDAAGTTLGATHHDYLAGSYNTPDPTLYPPWGTWREYQVETLDADLTTVLQRVAHTWVQRTPAEPGFVDDPNAYNTRLHDPRIIQTDTTWVPQGKLARQTFDYDAYNNKTAASEYDWGTTAPGPLLRATARSFLQAGYDTVGSRPDVTSHVRDLVSTETVSDAIGVAAQSAYYYDSATESSPTPVPPAGNLGAYGHDDTVFGTSWAKRGNLTRIRRLKTGSTYISVDRTYDVNGNLLSSTDARQNTANFEYADCFGGTGAPPDGKQAFAFVTTLRLPAARAGQNRFTEGYCHNYYLGRPTSHTDANSNPTYYGYEDVGLDRLKSVTAPGDGARTIYDYVDGPNPSVTTRRDKDTLGAGEIWSETLYDGLGRASGTRQSAKAGTIFTSTVYDGLNRQYQVSYPAYGLAGALTTHDYDTLGRVKSVCTSDSACTTNSYEGPVSTVTDAASNRRRLETDALGRLIAVTEAYGTADASTTYYRYDALGNLTRVCQGGTFAAGGEACTGGQLRRFQYDMLGRLISAENPESGATSYQYDENGNLTYRLMADGSTLQISYDNLNRPWRKTYSGARSTPEVTLCYDGEVFNAATGSCATAGPIPNARMHLTEVRTSESSTRYTGFHERGFLTGLEQTTDGSGPYVFSNFNYNLAGVLTGITYPSGRQLTYGVDTAGLVDAVNGQSVTYASIAYAAHGAPSSITFGNGLVERWQHSGARLQPEWVKLGTSGQPDSIGALRIAYCPGGFETSCGTNNGNVLNDGIKIGTSEVVRSYRFDAFNRLAMSVEAGNVTKKTCKTAGGRRCEHFGYDVFGNRTILDRSSDLTAPLSEPVAFDASNNRATGGSWQYDAAGNLRQDGAAMAMTYDGEGRMKTAGTWEYVYDGEGRRVLKRSGAGNRTVYVYGPDGELAAEYSTDAPAVAGVQYVSVDWLGSTRIVTGPAGQIQQRTDYLPFGAVVGFDASDPRSGQAGYGNDVVAQKFTGKERDGESGLDYFGARYSSGAQGRFTSPDVFAGPSPTPFSDLRDPQTLNLYAYVGNNPLNRTDAGGHAQVRPLAGTNFNYTLHDNPRSGDDPNVHVFDKSNREVARYRFREVRTGRTTPSGAAETGGDLLLTEGKELGANVRASILRELRSRGTTPRFALPEKVAGARSLAGRLFRGYTTLCFGAMMLDAVTDAMLEQRFRAETGMAHNMMGNLYFVDLEKAAQSVGEGNFVNFQGEIYVVREGEFISTRGCKIRMVEGQAVPVCPAA